MRFLGGCFSPGILPSLLPGLLPCCGLDTLSSSLEGASSALRANFVNSQQPLAPTLRGRSSAFPQTPAPWASILLPPGARQDTVTPLPLVLVRLPGVGMGVGAWDYKRLSSPLSQPNCQRSSGTGSDLLCRPSWAPPLCPWPGGALPSPGPGREALLSARPKSSHGFLSLLLMSRCFTILFCFSYTCLSLSNQTILSKAFWGMPTFPGCRS